MSYFNREFLVQVGQSAETGKWHAFYDEDEEVDGGGRMLGPARDTAAEANKDAEEVARRFTQHARDNGLEVGPPRRSWVQ